MQERPVSVSSYGAGGFSLANLTDDEEDILHGAFAVGSEWVRRGDDGRVDHLPVYRALPRPAEDVEMQPFWTPPGDDHPVQYEMFNHAGRGEYSQYSSPSILIQHLCGYSYTPDHYKAMAVALESYGFTCLRSRRDESGQFWEIWFLPAIWAARGALLEAIEGRGSVRNAKYKMKRALEFLRTNVEFGTLDVSVQRMAQVIE